VSLYIALSLKDNLCRILSKWLQDCLDNIYNSNTKRKDSFSTMSYTTLFQNLGFDSDPFAKTNADEEERLEQYFIAPPFFSAVYGDTNTPKSSICFCTKRKW